MRSTLFHRLITAQSALDQLVSDVSVGIRSQAQFDHLECEAQQIARAIGDAFRTPDANNPVPGGSVSGRTMRRSWHD